MAVAHETTQSVHFGAGALIPWRMPKKKKRRHRADFEMLIQRKTELYPRNRRLYMGIEVAKGAGGLNVKVLSTDLDRTG